MTLPSSACGTTTETVGLFRTDAARVAQWLGTDAGLRRRTLPSASVSAIASVLTPGGPLSRRALIPWADWTAVLTDGPRGTDVGMLPSLAARALDCVGIRATAVDPRSDRYEAVILEVYDPRATDDLLRCRRTIAAANDGGRWTFDQWGEPYEFEQVEAYRSRRIRDRFTSAMLFDYLRALGVPVDRPLDLGHALLVGRD